MLPRLLLLLSSFCLFSLQIFAQAYEPGLLVRSNGDTLRGEIENDFWAEPPTFIRFRPVPGSPSQLFLPRQLRAVSFTGGRYFRYEIVPLDHAAQTQLARLPRGNEISIQTDSLLAEVLVDGPGGTLLRIDQPSTVHYLLRSPNQPWLDLCERKYLRQQENGAWAITDGNNYRSQLALYYIKCPAAAQVAATTPFTAAGMAAVVQAYNQTCTAAAQPGRSWLTQAAPRRRYSFQGGVLAGARYNRIESPDYDFGTACTDCGVHPFGGLYAELFQPSRTAAVYGELSLSSFRNGGTRLVDYVSTGSGGYTNVYSTYSYRALLSTARLGVRFYVPLAHERQLIFGLGYEWNTVWNPKLSVISGPVFIPDEKTLVFSDPTLLPNLAMGWRSHRLTLSVDGQLYHTLDAADFYQGSFLGRALSVRLSTAYRLGRNPDVKQR